MAKCESNICRLLLPSGHDRLVDIKHPNIYSQLVHRELRKINCFDYLVSHTLEKQPSATKVPSNSHVSEDSAIFSDRSVSKSSDISSSAVRRVFQPPDQEELASKIEHLQSTQEIDQNSVKAALLLTSRAIYDIDYILEEK